MSLSAVGYIYEFRPLYRGETRAPVPMSTQADRSKPQQLDLFELSQASIPGSAPPPPDVSVDRSSTGVSTLLDRFFTEKVRRQDRDGDGRLSRAEFSGTDEEFAGLDTDSDGVIGAADFKRQFLADNPPLRGMAEGFARELYDQIMNSPANKPEELGGIVQSFFEELVDQHDADGDGALQIEELPGTADELRTMLPKNNKTINVDDLIAGFQRQNPDLVELRESLLQLREAVQPTEARPGQLDLYT